MSFGRNVRRTLLLGVSAGVVLVSGCGRGPTSPVAPIVRLALTATPELGDPSAPVSIRALVKNAGTTRVLHCSGCGCGSGISVVFLGPDGSEVALNDPNALLPACPDGIEPLGPAETLEATARFTGVLYERGVPTVPSPTYAAPAGTYTVIARFGYQSRPSGEWRPLERRVAFVWRP